MVDCDAFTAIAGHHVSSTQMQQKQLSQRRLEDVDYADQQEEQDADVEEEDANDNQNSYYANGNWNYNYNNNNNANGQNNYNNQQQDEVEEWEEEEPEEEAEQADQAVAQQAYDDAVNPDDGAVYNKFSVCSDAVIQVLDLKVYCDSPGTFYYGSGKYRNSATCKPGDKAKIQVEFYIAQPDVILSSGGYAILDISAAGNSGWYQKNVQVFENDDMCSSSNLKSLSKSTCPFQGKYRIRAHFYWPEDQYSANNSFDPVVTVGFKSSIKTNQYDFGGANTPYCRGSTFVTWTNGIRTTYANAIANFMATFGILLLTIVLMGGFIWFLTRKPTSIKDAGQKLGVIKKDVFADENFDFSSMRSPRQGQNLVDF